MPRAATHARACTHLLIQTSSDAGERVRSASGSKVCKTAATLPHRRHEPASYRPWVGDAEHPHAAAAGCGNGAPFTTADDLAKTVSSSGRSQVHVELVVTR